MTLRGRVAAGRRGRDRARGRAAGDRGAEVPGAASCAATLDDTLRRRAADVARLNATAPDQLTEPGALEGGGLLSCRSSTARGGSWPARARSAGACCRRRPRAARPPAGAGRRPARHRAAAASTPRRWASSARGEAAGGAVVVAGRPGRDRAHAGPHAPAGRALRARRRGARRRPGDAADAPRAAPADPAVVRRAGDRALRRRVASGCRSADARRGRRAGGHAERDARLARARAGGRAPLRRRRLARAAHAAHRAARQRRLHRPPRRRPGRARRHRGRRGRGSASCSTTCSRSPARTPPRRLQGEPVPARGPAPTTW